MPRGPQSTPSKHYQQANPHEEGSANQAQDRMRHSSSGASIPVTPRGRKGRRWQRAEWLSEPVPSAIIRPGLARPVLPPEVTYYTEASMRSSRLLVLAALTAVVGLAPVAAFAQQMPVAPDGTSVNEPPAAGPLAAEDSCGNTPLVSFGQTEPNGMPTGVTDVFPKDVTGAQPISDLSSVTGIVIHTAGNLVLIRMPMEPAAGMDNTAPPTQDRTMAVIRLPDGCNPPLTDGSRIKATGLPSMDGILNAERVTSIETAD